MNLNVYTVETSYGYDRCPVCGTRMTSYVKQVGSEPVCVDCARYVWAIPGVTLAEALKMKAVRS